MAQRELFEEERRRPVEERTAKPFAARDHVNEAAFEERFQNCPNVHPPDLGDIGAADRLPVGNDRERFECRA